MQELIEQVIGICGKAIYGEGERLLRIKILSLCLGVVNAARKALLLQYLLMIVCFLWAIGFFASGFLTVAQIAEDSFFHINAAYGFSLAILASSTLILYLAVRERTWINAIGLQKRMDEIVASPPSVDLFNCPGTAELSILIQRIIDEKLENAAKQKIESPTAPTSRSVA